MPTKNDKTTEPTILTVAPKAKRTRTKTDEQMSREAERNALLAQAVEAAGPVQIRDTEGNVLDNWERAAIVPSEGLCDVRNGRPLAASSLVPTVTAWAKSEGLACSVVERNGHAVIVLA